MFAIGGTILIASAVFGFLAFRSGTAVVATFLIVGGASIAAQLFINLAAYRKHKGSFGGRKGQS
jgi:hypothetical protein